MMQGVVNLRREAMLTVNATRDSFINRLSIQDQRIVITKDADFVESFLLQKQPHKLLTVSTGNIKKAELEQLFSQHLQQLIVYPTVRERSQFTH
jgi:predicted nuclease of predicted toxin-antitoxin system